MHMLGKISVRGQSKLEVVWLLEAGKRSGGLKDLRYFS